MYKYQDLAFRVVEEKDLVAIKELHNDQDTVLSLASIHLVDQEDQLNWFKNLYKKSNDKRFVICLADQPNHILGRLRIQNIDFQNSNTEIGLDIMPSERNKGYATKSYKMLLDFLFNHYNMNMIYLKVASYNQHAIAMYKKLGFEQTGFLKSYLFRHGQYNDYLIFCMERSMFIKTEE